MIASLVFAAQVIFTPQSSGRPAKPLYIERVGTPERLTADRVDRQCTIRLSDDQDMRVAFSQTGGRGFASVVDPSKSGISPFLLSVVGERAGPLASVKFEPESPQVFGSTRQFRGYAPGADMIDAVTVAFEETDRSDVEAVRIGRGLQLKARTVGMGFCTLTRLPQRPMAVEERNEFLSQ